VKDGRDAGRMDGLNNLLVPGNDVSTHVLRAEHGLGFETPVIIGYHRSCRIELTDDFVMTDQAAADGIDDILKQLRPYVRQTGDEWRPRWHIQERKLLDYILVYIAGGEGHFRVGDQVFDVKTRDLAWVPPDTLTEMWGTSGLMNVVYIHFDLLYDQKRSHWDACIPGGIIELAGCLEYMHPPVNDPVIKKLCGKVPLQNPMAVMQLMKRICLEHRRGGSHQAWLLSGMMMELLAEILRGMQPSRTLCPYHENSIREAASRIQEQPEENLLISQLAKGCRLSESHFRRLFREIFGESPKAMYNRSRMRRACEMLSYSNRNISEIAVSLGFSNVHNFSRAFREMNGQSPRAYRQG